MTVRFENKKYSVFFDDWIRIQRLKVVLFLRRQYRRLSVLFCKQDFALYFFVTILWAIFGVVIYGARQVFMPHAEQPYTVQNVFFDLAEPWFSSVILSFVIGAFNRTTEYRRKIRRQHYIYVTIMEEFGSLVGMYLEKENIIPHPMYCLEGLEASIESIKKCGKIFSPTDDNMILCLDKILTGLKKIDEELKEDRIIFCGKAITAEDIEAIIQKMNEILVKDIRMTADVVAELLLELQTVIDGIRQPWRVDIQYKKKILRILNKRSENKVFDNIYYKILLQEFQS